MGAQQSAGCSPALCLRTHRRLGYWQYAYGEAWICFVAQQFA